MNVDAAALSIPLAGIVFGCSVAMLSLYLQFRRRSEALKAYHAQRMAAIEKGIELPAMPPELLLDPQHVSGPPYVRHRRNGLVLLLVGAAVSVAIYQTDKDGYLWGLVPAAIGLALLVSSALEAREQRAAVRPDTSPPGYSGQP